MSSRIHDHQSAFPWQEQSQDLTLFDRGLTKRELFSLISGVPDSGDAELDEIIRKGQRQKFAAMAMQGLLSNLEGIRREGFQDEDIDEFARMRADALIKELEK